MTCVAVDKQTNGVCGHPAGWLLQMFCTLCRDNLVHARGAHLEAAREAVWTDRGITHSRDGGYLVMRSVREL